MELGPAHLTRAHAGRPDVDISGADGYRRDRGGLRGFGGGAFPDELVYLLDSLVDKSIVERAGDTYRMLETIRAYAADKLRLAGEDEAVLRGLTRYFADLAEEHEPLLRSDKQAESLRLFQAEYDNLMFALQTAIDSGDGSGAARILGPLYWYWVMLRYDARAEDYVAKVAEFGDALPTDARAAFTAIHLMGVEGEPLTDPERLRAVIDDCARTGALRRYPMLLTTVVVMAAMLGLDELLAQEIARVRSGSDRWAIACTFMIEAMAHRERGDRESSTTAMTTALRLFEEFGDRWWTAKALYGLAQIHAIAGDHAQAITAYEHSLAIATDLGSQDEVSTRLGLATERMRAGHLAGARHESTPPNERPGGVASRRWRSRCSASRQNCTAAPERSNAPIKRSTGWRRSPAS